MLKLVASILGIVIAVLAIIGLFVDGHILGIMNADLTIDILRVIIAAALLVVGFAAVSPAAVRTVVIVAGAVYVLVGLLAFFDSTLFGLLPSGLTAFDIAFHLIVGIGALVLALVPTGAKADGRTAARA